MSGMKGALQKRCVCVLFVCGTGGEVGRHRANEQGAVESCASVGVPHRELKVKS